MAMFLERMPLVWGVTGELGGGKTLTTVYFMVNAIRNGWAVVTNITLDMDAVCKDVGPWARDLYFHFSLDDFSVNPYDLPVGDPRGSGGRRRVLVVLDECAEWIDQYTPNNDPNVKRLRSWIRHSSKRMQDVFIIVQRPAYLHKVFRILITRWLNVRDLATWRVPLLRMHVPFMGGFIIFVPYDDKGERVGHASFVSKSSYGRFYNTAECLNSDGASRLNVYNVEIPKKSYLKQAFWFYVISIFILLSQMLN